MSADSSKPKQLGVRAAQAALRAIGATIDELRTEGSRLMQRVAIAIAEAEVLVTSQPKALPKQYADLTSWVQSHYDVSQPRCDTLKRAGRVALVIGPENIDGSVSEDALQTFHKVLSDQKYECANLSRDEREAAIRDLWAAASKEGRATIAACRKAVSDAYPSLAAQGSRGPKAGTEAAKGNGRKQPKQPKQTRNTPTSDGPKEVPDMAVSATRLKAAATRMTTLFAAFEDDAARAIGHKIASEVLETATRYGIAATSEALKAHAPKQTTPKRTRSRGKAAPKQQQQTQPKRSRAKAAAK